MNAIKWMGSLLVLLSFLSSPLRAADMEAAQRVEIHRLRKNIEAAFSPQIPLDLKNYIQTPEMYSVKNLENFIAVATYQSFEADFIYYNIGAITSFCVVVPAIEAMIWSGDTCSPMGLTAASIASACIPTGFYHWLRGAWAGLRMSAAKWDQHCRGIQRKNPLYKEVKAAFTQDSQLRFAYTGR